MKKAKTRFLLTMSGVLLLLFSSVVVGNGLDGRWSLQDRKNTWTILDEAVDKAASEMHFAVWVFNQSFLDNEKKICDVWRLKLGDEDFFWKCDDEKAQKMPTNANQLDVEERGRIIEKTFSYSSNHVSTSLKEDFVTRTHVWRKISDIQMEYSMVVESANLPKPLKWTLIYRRH